VGNPPLFDGATPRGERGISGPEPRGERGAGDDFCFVAWGD